MSADERLRRLLAMVPWVVGRDGPTVEEVCARFAVSEDQLVSDLELLFLCGLHPYTPDMLIEAEISERRVWIRYADYFTRPLRLTPSEALALVAAGRALLAVPGTDPDGPLARGLGKLAAALGIKDFDQLEVDPGVASADVLAVIRDAIRRRVAIEMSYYSFGRDEHTHRTIDPYEVFSAAGRWYVSAHCHTADDERLFRVDRIADLALTDHTFMPPSGPRELAVYSARPDDPRVVLDLPADATWVIEQYPVEDVEHDDDRLRVRLAVSERAWLERLLLRLGPDVRVVEGPTDAACKAAEAVLDRYRTGSQVS